MAELSVSSGGGGGGGYSRTRSYDRLDPMQRRNQRRNVNQFFRARDNFDRAGFQRNYGRAGDMTLEAGMAENPYLGRGMQRTNQFTDPNNQLVQQQANMLGLNIQQQLGQQFQQIGGQAGAAQQRGGGRQGVAQGLASQGAMQQYMQGLTNLQTNAYNQAQQATFDRADLFQGNAALAQQQQQQQMYAGQQYADILGQQQAAYFQPFEIGANVVGDPSVLNRSRSYTWNRGREGTDSFGIGF